MDTDQVISLARQGDQFEQETWTNLEPYLSKYEVVWRMHVVPLRSRDSIYLRPGIDANLETFAMNNYTAYVNMARALEKIDTNADDLKYSEEIWANLQRAVEVAKKAADAFSRVYGECTRSETRINTLQLDNAEESVKIYRNRLHDPIPATLKNEHGTRLIPKRDKLKKYSRWTTAMFDNDLSDFVSVESQLRDDFCRVCSSLQDFWTQIERLLEGLLRNAEYQGRSAASFGGIGVPRYRIINADSSSGATQTGSVSLSGSLSASDWIAFGPHPGRLPK
jgi:hypothetical protein